MPHLLHNWHSQEDECNQGTSKPCLDWACHLYSGTWSVCTPKPFFIQHSIVSQLWDAWIYYIHVSTSQDYLIFMCWMKGKHVSSASAIQFQLMQQTCLPYASAYTRSKGTSDPETDVSYLYLGKGQGDCRSRSLQNMLSTDIPRSGQEQFVSCQIGN